MIATAARAAAILFLLFWLSPAQARELCDDPQALKRAIAEASALTDPSRKRDAFRSLVSLAAQCAPTSTALYDVRHAAALFAVDDSIIDFRLVDEDIRAARAARDHANLIAIAGRALARQVGSLEMAEMAKDLDEAAAALNGNPYQRSRLGLSDIAMAAPYSPHMCDIAVGMVARQGLSNDNLALGALRCTLRLNSPSGFREVLPALVDLASAGVDLQATSDFEQLLAYATVAGDREAVERIAVRVRHAAARMMNTHLTQRLRLALASAFHEIGAPEEARAEVDACSTGSSPSDICKLAAAILDPFDHDAMLQVSQAIRSDEWANSPSLAYPALRNVQARIIDDPAAADDMRGDFGNIALPNMLRLCLSIANGSMKRDFVGAAHRAGAIMRAEDRRLFDNCLSRAIERDDALNYRELAALLPLTLSAAPPPEGAKLRLMVAQALLADLDGREAVAAEHARALLKALDESDASAEAVIDRMTALKLLLRIAYDRNDAKEAALLRAKLVDAGETVPVALRTDERPAWEAVNRSAVIARSAFDEWRFARTFADPDKLLISSEAQRLGKLQADLNDTVRAPTLAQRTKADTARFRADRDLQSTVAMSPACIAANLDAADGQDGLISDIDNRRINELTPSLDDMRELISLMPSWLNAGSVVGPFEITRPHRSGDQAVADISYEIEIFWRLGRPAMVLKAHRVLREIRSRYLAAGRMSCVLARFETRTDAYAAALLEAARQPGVSEDEKLELVGDAFEVSLSVRQVFSSSRAERDDKRLEQELEQRRIRAIATRDVEGARALLDEFSELAIRRMAAARMEQPQPLESLAERLRRAKSRLRPNEAILAWERTTTPAGAPLLVTALVGSGGMQIAAKRIDEWRDNWSEFEFGEKRYTIDFDEIQEQLDAEIVAARRTTIDFDDRAARAIYGLTLGQLQLAGVERLFVIREPSDFPTALMSAPSGDGDTSWLVDLYDILYLQPDLGLPRDDMTISNSGKVVAFASPDYGSPRGPSVTTVEPATDNRIYPRERRSFLTNFSPCGLQPLPPLPLDGIGENLRAFVGRAATEARLHQENSNRGLRDAQLLLFFAHGEEIPIEGSRSMQFGIAMTPRPGCPGYEEEEAETLSRPASSLEDGFLTAVEIATLELNLPMVILAGCNMARGGTFSGSALPAAFFAAGSKIIVGSTREVLTKHTSALVARLLESTRDGAPAASAALDALRQSRQDASGNGGDSSHPVYWGSWRVMVN